MLSYIVLLTLTLVASNSASPIFTQGVFTAARVLESLARTSDDYVMVQSRIQYNQAKSNRLRRRLLDLRKDRPLVKELIRSSTLTKAAGLRGGASEEGSKTTYDFDLVVIGGGSGGLAAAKKAAKYGKKVLLFDFVKPSTKATVWGIGGTCVNVGCVPKKLMHYAGLMGHTFSDAKKYGYDTLEYRPSHTWSALVEAVQNHVRMLNFRYRSGLRSDEVLYTNALAKIAGPHEISYEEDGVEKTITAANIVIAVGGRPVIPTEVPGAREYAITSDDIFSLEKPPGKTLVVGASYIALECAGFLTELGYSTTVAVRSIPLRGFDQQAAELIGDVMKATGTRFVRPAIPQSITRIKNGALKVVLVDPQTGAEVLTDTFDTVLYATGRVADTAGLGLDNAGINVLSNGKIPVVDETTNVPHIFAIGDCSLVDVEFHDSHWANPELTPVAIKAGQLLASRIFGEASEKMDYTLIPTAVFTPSEYGAVGLSEEDAIKMFGEDDVETYLQEFTSLEAQAAHRKVQPYRDVKAGHRGTGTTALKHKSEDEEEEDDYYDDPPSLCLSKLVCRKSEDERVVGFHFVGPNAGEITQGFALALKLGAKKRDFDSVIGIHPTDAESFCGLSVTRSSGTDFKEGLSCGGGSCG